MKKIINHNCPEELFSIAQKWAENDMTFYLGPENMFSYNNFPINYSYCPNISRQIGDWYICSEDCHYPVRLTKEQAEDIQCNFHKNKFPTFAIISIGYTCNLNCHMCLYHGEEKEFYKENYSEQCIEVDTQTVKQRLKKLKEIGITTVFIGTNGEIFLRNDWEELFEYAQKLGFKFIFTTNATVINEKILKKLEKFKNDIINIKVSINAFHSSTYQNINKSKNDKFLKNAMNAVLELNKIGIATMPSFVVTEKNKADIGDFVKYWSEKGINQYLANKIELKDFVNGTKGINNTHWPYFHCKSMNSMVLVQPSGQIANCCRTAYAIDDKNSFDIFQIHIDEDVHIIKDKWAEALEKKVYAKFCSNCALFELNSPVNNTTAKIFNYPCVITDLGVVVTPEKKERKPFHLKIKREINYFSSKLIKKLCKVR